MKSDRLLKEIQEQGISYGQLSQKTGINKADLQRYATGKTKKIPTERIMIIAAALNVSPSFLLGFSEIQITERKPWRILAEE